MGINISKGRSQKKAREISQTAAVVGVMKSAAEQRRCSQTTTAKEQQVISENSSQEQEVPEEHIPSSREISVKPQRISLKRLRFEKEDEVFSIPCNKAAEAREEEQKLCAICGVYTGLEVFPCRVCLSVYHDGCLKKIGRLLDEESASAFARAGIGTGWSCFKCESLSVLLSEEEMIDLTETFDKYDINQDTVISKEEFMRYRKNMYNEQHNDEMPEDVEKEMEQEFKLMDRNKTDTIDWWEFLNHQSLRLLSKRKKIDLVKLLSVREIHEARQTFRVIDQDGDNHITSSEAFGAYTRWFTNLQRRRSSSLSQWKNKHSRAMMDTKQLHNHIDVHTNILMEADSNKDRLVSWEEYLSDQALYILAARPNHYIPPRVT